jgi:hypothetical protein
MDCIGAGWHLGRHAMEEVMYRDRLAGKAVGFEAAGVGIAAGRHR